MRSHRPSKRGPDIRRKLAGLQEPNASEKETMESSVATSAIIQPMSKLFSNGAVGPNGYAKRRQIADLFTAKKNAATGKRGVFDDDDNKENSLPARRSKKFLFKTASGITIADESLLGDDEVSSHVRCREDGEWEVSSNRRDPVDEWRPTLHDDDRERRRELDDFDKRRDADRDFGHFATKVNDRHREDGRMNDEEFDDYSDSGSTRGSHDYKQRDYRDYDCDERRYDSRYGENEDEKGHRYHSRYDERDEFGHRRDYQHEDFDAGYRKTQNSKAVTSHKDRHYGDDEAEMDYFGEKERAVGTFRRPKGRTILGFRV